MREIWIILVDARTFVGRAISSTVGLADGFKVRQLLRWSSLDRLAVFLPVGGADLAMFILDGNMLEMT
jgi:hypothetical protein